MEIYTYRIGVFASPSADRGTPLPDVTGFDVEATDGHIGKVDEATNEAASSASSSTPDFGSSARSG